ncbi:MAG: hypothetical protein IJY03_10490 [Prevotella sp.]|nr:hypothetical protein [Prevotella sp.]
MTQSKCIEPILFLTACVNPNGMAYTKLNNPEVRQSQYMYALDWYLKNTTFKILLVENSNCDFSSEYKDHIRSGRLEFLTFNGNGYARSKGKGYGEAVILDYGIRHSNLLKVLPTEEVFLIKVTGRLICKNISTLYARYHNKNIVYANLNKDDWNGNIASSQLVMAPKSFWEHSFLPKRERIDDRMYCHFEHILYDSIMEWRRSGGRHREFWISPMMEGVSGTSALKIENKGGIGVVLRYRIMYILRRFLGYRGYENPFYHGQPKSPIIV